MRSLRQWLAPIAVVAALIFFAVPPPQRLKAAITATPVFVQTPKMFLTQFLQGTDTAGTYKTLVTAGSDGSKVTAIWMNNNDGSATHLVTCQLVRSAVKYGGVALTSVSNAGFASGTPAQDLFSATLWPGKSIDSDGNQFIYLQSGDTIDCTFATALTSSTLINVAATAANF